MINKKGSHVGMILSFLVFITFLAFLYSVIEPATRSQEDKLDLVEYLKTELVAEFTADMSTVIFGVSSGGCFEFETPSGLVGKGVVAKDENDLVHESYIMGTDTRVEYGTGSVLKLYYSDEFSIPSPPKTACSTLTSYDIDLFRTTEEIFESRILNLSTYFEDKSNYESFKEEKGIGFGDEFGFAFSNESREVVTSTEDRNASTDIFVQEVPIQYMDSEANIKSGFLNIKVW